jgi:hypothetical protein
MARVRRIVTSVVAWIAAAAAAVAVALYALSSIGDGLSGKPAIPAAEAVTAAGASADPSQTPDENPTTTPGSDPTVGPAPTATGVTTSTSKPTQPSPTSSTSAAGRQLSTRGGDIVARCEPGGAYLVYWTPAAGYRAADILRGPATTARLVFESDRLHVRVSVSCVNGVPEAHQTIDD